MKESVHSRYSLSTCKDGKTDLLTKSLILISWWLWWVDLNRSKGEIKRNCRIRPPPQRWSSSPTLDLFQYITDGRLEHVGVCFKDGST